MFRAFEQLIEHLLAESEESQQEWKRLILTAVGPNAGVIAEAAADRRESMIPLDFATLAKAARAIAVELEFSSLLKTLVQICIESAGAQRGVFLQERDGELRMMAQGTIDHASVLDAAVPDYAAGLPRSITQYVRKTSESLVLENALTDPRFVDDPPHSIGRLHSRNPPREIRRYSVSGK
jgi:GAF domain-containing protein